MHVPRKIESLKRHVALIESCRVDVPTKSRLKFILYIIPPSFKDMRLEHGILIAHLVQAHQGMSISVRRETTSSRFPHPSGSRLNDCEIYVSAIVVARRGLQNDFEIGLIECQAASEVTQPNAAVR